MTGIFLSKKTNFIVNNFNQTEQYRDQH